MAKQHEDIGIFISDKEATAARDTPGLFKDHREFVISEFAKHGFAVTNPGELRYSLRTIVVYGKNVDGFYVQGILGKSVIRA